MNTPCVNATTAGEGRKKRPFSKDEETNIKKTNEFLEKLKVANADVYADADKMEMARVARVSAEKDAILKQELGDMVRLDPTQTDRVGSWLARTLGQKMDIIKGLLTGKNEFTLAGDVRDTLLSAQRVAHGLLDDAGLLESTHRIADLMDAIKRKGLKGAVVDEVYQQVIEVGRTTQDIALYGNSPGMRNIAAWRYNNFMKDMADRGFDALDVDELVDLSSHLHAANDEFRMIGLSQGLDVPMLQGMGYFNRIATPDFQKFMQANVEPSVLKMVYEGKVSLSGAFNKARTTNWYAPIHEELGAALLDISPEKLNELLLDPAKFRNHLDENLTADQLDLLVETGIFKSLPMTGAESFRYVVDQYQLPFKEINEMWKLNPYDAMAGMATNMKKPLGNAAVIKTAIKDGLDAGWSIPASQATGAEYKGWVSSKGIDLTRYGITDEAGSAFSEDILIHPLVAEQMNDLLTVASSPAKLGSIMSYIQQNVLTLYKVNVVATAPAYMMKILFGNALMTMGSGGNPAMLIPASLDMYRVAQKGLQAFDNVKPLNATVDGVEMTQQNLLKKLLIHRGEDIAPETAGVAIGRVDWSTFNPLQSKRALTNMVAYAKAYGTDPLNTVIKGVDYATYLSGKLLHNTYSLVAVNSRMADMAARWAVVQSHVARGGNVDWRDLMRTIDDRFYMYDDLGKVPQSIAKNVFPFSSWVMQNYPAMVRFAMKNPEKFIAYNRLLQTISYENRAEGKDGKHLPEAAYRTDYLNEYPITVGYDPLSGHQYSMMPNQYDPLTDAFSNTVSSGDALLRIAFGKYAGTTEEQTRLATGGQKQSAQDYLIGLVARSFFARPIQALGIDLRNQKFEDGTKDALTQNTYGGMPVSGVVRGALMSVPFTRHLENSGALGTPQSKFYQTQAKAPLGIRIVNALGLNIQTVDTLANLNYSIKDMERAATEMKSALVKFSTENAGKLTTEQMSPEQQAQYRHYTDTYLQIKADLLRLDAYKKANNITTPELQKRLDRKLLKERVQSGRETLPGASIISEELQKVGN